MGPGDIAALGAIGVLAGVFAGYLGIGGGAVLTPLCILIYPALGIPDDSLVRVVFGTNMVLIFAYSLAAALKHSGQEGVDRGAVARMAPFTLLGSFFGALWAGGIDQLVLKRGFALLLIVSALLIVIQGTLRPAIEDDPDAWRLSRAWLPVLGGLTGVIGSMLGVGGGVVMLAPLILLFRLPTRQIAGTSNSITLLTGIAGAVGYMRYQVDPAVMPGVSSGYIWWSAAIPLAIGGVPAARLGAWLNGRTKTTVLRRVFGVALFLSALRMLW